MTAAIGVTSPVHPAYLHQVVSSEQRATVVSFDSMVSNTGGVVGQIGLGALGQARSIASAFAWEEPPRRSQHFHPSAGSGSWEDRPM